LFHWLLTKPETIILTMRPLVIFGTSNIISDLVDAAMSVGWSVRAIVRHDAEDMDPRSVSLADRLSQWATVGIRPAVLDLDNYHPLPDDACILGPTTPTRARLAALVKDRWGIEFTTLVHRTAYVSPLAHLGQGTFIGANSVVAPGTSLAEHVFVNRGVTVGHDNKIGAFCRIQPGAALGGLSEYGIGVTVGIGARTLERLHVGEGAVIAGGAVVLEDVPAHVMVAGVPARIKKHLL
jgi:sugar O-acyltransferase (sialic acid O-acetyltransferase NeuD family)